MSEWRTYTPAELDAVALASQEEVRKIWDDLRREYDRLGCQVDSHHFYNFPVLQRAVLVARANKDFELLARQLIDKSL